LACNVRRSVLERVAFCCKTDILAGVDTENIASAQCGVAERFSVETYRRTFADRSDSADSDDSDEARAGDEEDFDDETAADVDDVGDDDETSDSEMSISRASGSASDVLPTSRSREFADSYDDDGEDDVRRRHLAPVSASLELKTSRSGDGSSSDRDEAIAVSGAVFANTDDYDDDAHTPRAAVIGMGGAHRTSHSSSSSFGTNAHAAHVDKRERRVGRRRRVPVASTLPSGRTTFLVP
jgi:hypothetical protein